MSDCNQTIIITEGTQGPPGANGSNGISSIATLTAQFIMPAELADDSAFVDDSRGFAVGSTVFMQNCGILLVVGIPDANTMTLRNLEDTVNGLYPDNVAPGTAIPTMSTIVPSGIQGPSGVGAGSIFQLGNGAPVAGVTPNTPPIYIDVFTVGGPYFYFNVLGSWYAF